jgi:hypothetical protein
LGEAKHRYRLLTGARTDRRVARIYYAVAVINDCVQQCCLKSAGGVGVEAFEAGVHPDDERFPRVHARHLHHQVKILGVGGIAEICGRGGSARQVLLAYAGNRFPAADVVSALSGLAREIHGADAYV